MPILIKVFPLICYEQFSEIPFEKNRLSKCAFLSFHFLYLTLILYGTQNNYTNLRLTANLTKLFHLYLKLLICALHNQEAYLLFSEHLVCYTLIQTSKTLSLII